MRIRTLCLTLISSVLLALPALSQAGSGPGKHATTLACAGSSSSSVTGYNFYRGDVSGGPYTKLNASAQSSCSYTDSTVVNGKTYFYVATGIYSAGETVFSNEVQAVIPVPGNPPGSVLVDVGQTKATLTWNAISGATGYNIWRATGAAAPVQIGTVASGVLTYSDTTIVAGQTYTWYVTSVSANGESVLSAAAIVRPAPPTNLQVTIQ